MDPHYMNLVKEWVKLDNIIARNNTDIQLAKERVSEPIEEKKRIEKDIIDYIQTSKLENMQLKISDGVITFSKRTTQKPITQKFIKEILEKYADENPSDNIEHNKISEFILSNIEKKIEYSISRKIKDNV